MGNVNNYLYAEGYNGGAPHKPFYDITSGCNNNDITAFYGLSYYCAAAGYDLATGWGSANMLQLAWAINWHHVPGFSIPKVSIPGPATNTWYNTDQEISWTVSAPAGNSYPSDGLAGFTQGWDSIPSDPSSEATPGSGSSYYSGPQYANATTGCLSLAGGFGCAGGVSQGFHTAHVQAWEPGLLFRSCELRPNRLRHDSTHHWTRTIAGGQWIWLEQKCGERNAERL